LQSKVRRQQTHQLVSSEREIQDERHRLRQQIKKWRHDQREIMSKIGDRVAALLSCEVEDERLFLPSDFDVHDHHQYGLEQLVREEMKLREGQAHDALRDLRAAIKYGRTLNQHRKDHVRKQGPATRAKEIIFDARLKQSTQAEKYRAAHAAMVRLGRTDNAFPELKDGDMYTKDTMAPHALGDGSKTEGWIWNVGPLGKMSETEYEDWTKESEWHDLFNFVSLNLLILVDRVQWFRAQADMWRWQEELEILEEEFRRTARAFDRMAFVWKELARRHTRKGYVAYAHEKSAMYRYMAKECKEKFEAAGGTWPETGTSLTDHIRSAREKIGLSSCV